ncbi:unnamed protein product, partial [marine sediment metagenome]
MLHKITLSLINLICSSPITLISPVAVINISPIAALEAAMEGFQVMPISKAAKIGD